MINDVARDAGGRAATHEHYTASWLEIHEDCEHTSRPNTRTTRIVAIASHAYACHDE